MAPNRAHPSLRPLALLTVLTLGCSGQGSGPVEQFTVPRGAGFAQVADSLEAHGLIGSRMVFTLVARFGGYDRALRPGVYQFRRGDGAKTILQALRDGRVLTVKVTIPEGFTLIDIGVLLEERLEIPADSFLARARDTAQLRDLRIPAPTAEGFLPADTYHLPAGIDAGEALRLLAAHLDNIWDPAWDSILTATGRTRTEVLTLASIVEGEAAVDDERPVIAGVYSNRIRLGMPLQADPTVQYAIQLATGSRKPRLFNRDYEFPSRYNTYLHPGLPPGPVGAPGRKSIEAALQPADVPWLYFVASGGGRHTFTRTYGEHLRAVARARNAQ